MSGATFPAVAALIAQVCEISPSEVNLNGRLIGYQIDSLRAVELLAAMEETFSVELDRDAMLEVKTVAELVDRLDLALADAHG